MPFFPDNIAASHSCSSFTPMTCSRHFSSRSPNLQFTAIIALRLSVAVSVKSNCFSASPAFRCVSLTLLPHIATGIRVSDQMAHMESQSPNTFASGFCFSQLCNFLCISSFRDKSVQHSIHPPCLPSLPSPSQESCVVCALLTPPAWCSGLLLQPLLLGGW